MNGSIRKRGKNTWQLTIDQGRNSDGSRSRKFVSVKGSKKHAQLKLRELVTKLDKGLELDTTKATVGQFLDKWLEIYVKTNTSARTTQSYKGIVRQYLTPYIGKIPVAKLASQQVQGLYANLLVRGLSARTVIHAHRVLSESSNHGVKWGLLTRNICESVDPPRPIKKEMATLRRNDMKLFLDASRDSPYREVFLLALYTGMRRSELMGLTWSAIDFDLQMLTVSQTLIRITGQGLKTMKPKSNKSLRQVNLSPEAVVMLRELKDRSIRLLGQNWNESAYVFSRAGGTPFDPDTITHAFASMIKKAGINHMRFHDLRHTHATILMEQGINPKTVAERLGHASVVITLDTYSHVMPGLQAEAAIKFEEVLHQSDS